MQKRHMLKAIVTFLVFFGEILIFMVQNDSIIGVIIMPQSHPLLHIMTVVILKQKILHFNGVK